jgi:hypothetical protein
MQVRRAGYALVTYAAYLAIRCDLNIVSRPVRGQKQIYLRLVRALDNAKVFSGFLIAQVQVPGRESISVINRQNIELFYRVSTGFDWCQRIAGRNEHNARSRRVDGFADARRGVIIETWVTIIREKLFTRLIEVGLSAICSPAARVLAINGEVAAGVRISVPQNIVARAFVNTI